MATLKDLGLRKMKWLCELGTTHIPLESEQELGASCPMQIPLFPLLLNFSDLEKLIQVSQWAKSETTNPLF